MKKTTIIILLLVFGKLGSISLEECWRLAEGNNLSIKQQYENAKSARLSLNSAKAEFYPKVYLKSGYQYKSKTSNLGFELQPDMLIEKEIGENHNFDLAVSVEQPLFTGFKVTSVCETAEMKIAMEEMKKELIRNEINKKITDLYFAMQLNLQKQKIIKNSISRTNARLNDAKNLFQTGQILEVDTLEISTIKYRLYTQQQQLQDEIQVLQNSMSSILNSDKKIDVSRQDKPFKDNYRPIEESQKIVLKDHPQLKIMNIKRDIGKENVKIASADLYPKIFGGLEYHYGKPNVEMMDADWDHYYVASLQMEWNIWDTKKTINRRKEELSRLNAINFETADIKNKIFAQISNQYERIESLEKQLKFHKRLVEQERRFYEHKKQLYQNGNANSSQLRIAEENLSKAQLELVEVKILLSQEIMNIDYQCGILGKKH